MLFTPLDPVVATPRTREDAHAAIATLATAGFGRGMLSLVDADAPAAGTASRAPSSWKTSGALWGLLWIGGTTLATWTVPMGTPAFGALVMLGAVALVMQATFAARLVTLDAAAQLPARVAGQREPHAFKVLVHGSRSDVALARAILAA